MKNVLKKIGIIAIIIGVLSPFITLPRVNAANEECKYYLNQYLFLDVFFGKDIDQYEVGEGIELGQRTFTNFMYTFETPADDETIEIINSGNVNLRNKSGLKEYFNAYSQFYGDDNKLSFNQLKNIKEFGAWVTTAEYENVTTVVHGKWASEDDGIAQTSTWPGFTDYSDFEKQTIQHYIPNDVDLQVRLGGATLEPNGNTEKFGLPRGTYKHNFKDYMDKIINDYNSNNDDSYENKYLIRDNNEVYFNLNIIRKINSSDFDNIVFGYTDGSNKLVLSTEEGDNKTTNSYKAFTSYKENNDSCPSNSGCYLNNVTNNTNYDIDLKDEYYWPVLYNVEYKICKPVSDTPSSWTLTYDRGVTGEEVNKVLNMPSPNPQTGLTDKSVNLSSTIPEREGYEFKSWCTEENGKGLCVEAGKEFKNDKMEDKKLFAYWIIPGTEENDKKGVISYVIGFLCVGLVAYGLYYVINKKNPLKQI